MEKIIEDDIDEIKKKLADYKRENIRFNEPHFTERLILREGNREDVVYNLLNPNKLVYSYQEKGKYGDIIHCLHFKISNKRTMRLPQYLTRKVYISSHT